MSDSDAQKTFDSLAMLSNEGLPVDAAIQAFVETLSTDVLYKLAKEAPETRASLSDIVTAMIKNTRTPNANPRPQPAASSSSKASSSSSKASQPQTSYAAQAAKPSQSNDWGDEDNEEAMQEYLEAQNRKAVSGGAGGAENFPPLGKSWTNKGKVEKGNGGRGKGKGVKGGRGIKGGRGGKGECNDDEAREKEFVKTIFCANKGKKCTRWCEESGMRKDGKCFTHGEAARAGTECFGMNHVNTPEGYGEFPTGWHNNGGYWTGIPNAQFSLALDESGVKCIYTRVGETPAWWDEETGKWQKEVVMWEKSDENAYEAFQTAARAAAAAKWAESQNS